MTADTAAPPSRTNTLRDDLDLGVGALLARGVLAGAFGGLVFLLGNMGWAVHNHKPALAPLIDISTIFHGQDMPMPVAAGPFGPDNAIVGLTTHLMLSTLFGIGFALLVTTVLRRRPPSLLVGAGIAYGLALYVVNFQILGRIFFKWFSNSNGPPQGFEVFIHLVFGLILVPFFLGALRRGRATSPS